MSAAKPLQSLKSSLIVRKEGLVFVLCWVFVFYFTATGSLIESGK